MIKKIATIMMAVVLGLSMCFTIMPDFAHAADSGVTAKSVTKKAKNYTVQLVQDKVNYLPVKVTLPKYKKLKKAKISKIKVTFEMKNGSTVTTSKSTTVKFNKKKTFKVNAPSYGKFTVKLKFYKGKKLKKTVTVKNLGIVAEEYNLAMHDGTMSPLFFTMSLMGAANTSDARGSVKTVSESGAPIPTFVSASRDYMYNWKYMPKNTYRNPMMKSSSAGNLNKKTDGMAAYAKMLKSLNNKSKFHFYITDDNILGVDKIIYQNRFSDSQFDLVLITDGSRSATEFNQFYGGDNAQSVYNSMVNEWKTMIDAHRAGQSYSWTRLKNLHGDENFEAFGLSYYAYAVASADNVVWWVSRKDNFKSTDSAFLSAAQAKMVQVPLNNMLADLQAQGKSEQLKNLLKFDKDMFAAANNNKKVPLVIMGTRVNLEVDFEPFESYINEQFGKEYEIYYKGHPATPTALYPEKKAQLDQFGIHDIESSIPAELILFYYPEIMVAGESKSTLNESYIDGHKKVYKGMRLEPAMASASNPSDAKYYLNTFESFFTRINDSYEEPVKELCTSDNCFLIEFNKEVKDVPYDIAIFDQDNNTIKYYVLDEETAKYVEVDKDGNKIASDEDVSEPEQVPEGGDDEAEAPAVTDDNTDAETGDAAEGGDEVQP